MPGVDWPSGCLHARTGHAIDAGALAGGVALRIFETSRNLAGFVSWCGFGGGAGADKGDKTDDNGAETIHWVLH